MGSGLVRIEEQTPQRHMFERDWTISSNIIEYSTLNIEHNCKETYMSIQHFYFVQ